MKTGSILKFRTFLFRGSNNLTQRGRFYRGGKKGLELANFFEIPGYFSHPLINGKKLFSMHNNKEFSDTFAGSFLKTTA